MIAAVTRDLRVPVGNNVILEALNYASQQLAGYYAWPWFLSEATWTFRAPLTGTCTVSSTGVFTIVSISDPDYYSYIDRNWRIMIGISDYPIASIEPGEISADSSKVGPVASATPVDFTLFHAGLTMPADYRPGTDFACYHTTLRYRIRHVNRMAFERHWQAYKQMSSQTSLVYSEREPFYDAIQGWRHQLQFCPPPAGGTQVRISYQRRPSDINPVTNLPIEWPVGYDEVIELLALGRIGQKTGDLVAVNAAKRAQGLVRQLRGAVATAIIDETPQQGSGFSGASWEQDGLSVLPRENF
jgi:hypothetical protein